ncbi:MAG: cation transporter [Acidobacteria bacterium]|nr:cation transporter [Acidobacteriota bacterium]
MTGEPTRRDRSTTSQSRRLGRLLVLNLILIGALVAVGLATSSLAVLAAAGDFVADSLAIVLGLVAVRLRDVGGLARAPVFVALVNGLLLLVVTLWVVVESLHRLITGVPEVDGLPVLVVAAASTIAMLLGVLILGTRSGAEDLHMRSVLLDTLSDAVSSAAVAIVGGVMLAAHGLYWLDPVVGALIGLVVGVGAVRLLRDVVTALRTRSDLDVDDD